MRSRLVATCVAAGVALLAACAEAADTQKIQLELNDLQAADQGCRAVFVIHNGLGQPVNKLTLRVVTFDRNGRAKLFMSLDVGALLVNKTRVLRFDLGPDAPCSDLSRFVLDDVTSCEAPGFNQGQCLAATELSTHTSVPFDF